MNLLWTYALVHKRYLNRLHAINADLLEACESARNGLILLRHGEKLAGHLDERRDEIYSNALSELNVAIAQAKGEEG